MERTSEWDRVEFRLVLRVSPEVLVSLASFHDLLLSPINTLLTSDVTAYCSQMTMTFGPCSGVSTLASMTILGWVNGMWT